MTFKKLSRVKMRLKRKFFMKKAKKHWYKRPEVKPWVFCSFCKKHFDWWERIHILNLSEYYWDLNIEREVLKTWPQIIKLCCKCAEHSKYSIDKISGFIENEISQNEVCEKNEFKIKGDI